VRCDERQLQLSRLMDAETDGLEQAGLFTHLEGCAECRHFFDSLIRFRSTARQDREEILRQADERLPARFQLPAQAGARRAPGVWLSSWWRPALPAPAAIAFAVLLLVAGIVIGVNLAAHPGRAPQRTPDAEQAKQPPGGPTYIYVCSMPQIEVTGKSTATSGE
jgi:predicted anti-sigma-YlaC factor YlaD